MDNDIRVLVLKIIKFGGDITPLIKMGYDYSQVVVLIRNEINAGNATRINGELIITEAGNALIEVLSKMFNRKNSAAWIEPEYQSKIVKIDINDIFLPSQDDLSF